MTHLKPVSLTIEQFVPRLDQFLAKTIDNLSRNQSQKLIRRGDVLVNQATAIPKTSLNPGDTITVYLPTVSPETSPQPETIPLDIVYEDDDVVVLNKPVGMVVHPAHGHLTGTLVNALLAHYPDMTVWQNLETGPTNRPGIVHRLDQDTSGLMVIARNPAVLPQLQRQFKERSVKKTYLALVNGNPPAPVGLIDVPLGRDPVHRQKMAVQANGKPARTHYRVVHSTKQYSLLEIDLETGRTHQIRVHLAWLNCPVVGDTVYGWRKNHLGLSHQFLHASQLQFTHPHTGEELSFTAPLANNLQTIISRLF